MICQRSHTILSFCLSMILFHFFWLAHSTSIQSKIHALCTIRWISKPLKQSAVIWFGQSPVCDFHFISLIKRLNGKTIVSVFGFVFVSNVSYVYTILAHKHTHSEQIHCNGLKINVYEYVCWCACVRLDYTLDCRMSFRCKKNYVRNLSATSVATIPPPYPFPQ